MASGAAFFDFSLGARSPAVSSKTNRTAAQMSGGEQLLSSPSSNGSPSESLFTKAILPPRKKSAPKKCLTLKSKKTMSESNSKQESSIASSLSSSFSLRDYSPNETPCWVPDEVCSSCMLCGDGFNFWVRRHHCRLCGAVACHDCSKWTMQLPNLGYGTCKQRVCQPCWSVQSAVSTAADDAFEWDLFTFEEFPSTSSRKSVKS